jgi:ATP-dependent Clp protease ATP-binding subunit ClpC
MQDRFTNRLKKVINIARQEAIRMRHDYIGSEHLLLGIVKEGEGVAALVLSNLGIEKDELISAIENAVSYGSTPIVLGEIPLNQEARRILNYAMEEARRMNHSYIGTEHLLLGILKEEQSIAAQVLFSLGIDIDIVRSEIMKILEGESLGQTIPKSKSKTPALDYFSRDLTQLAREDKLGPNYWARKRD